MTTATPDDARLLDAWGREGDRAALDELVRRHWPVAHSTALAVLRDPVAAEDAAQEACVALARVRSTRAFDARRPFGPWFRALALNAARKQLRSSRRRARHEGLAPAARGPASGAEERAQEAEALEHLSRLPDRVRAPVALRFLGGCTYDEVAVALGCPKETARSRIQAGLERLRASMQAAGCVVPLDLAVWLAGLPRAEAPSPAAPTGATIALLAEGATRAGRAVKVALLALVALPVAVALAWSSPAAPPARGEVAAVASGAGAGRDGADDPPARPATALDATAAATRGDAPLVVPPLGSRAGDRAVTVRVRDVAGAAVPGAWISPATGDGLPEWGDPLVRADSTGVARVLLSAGRVWARAGVDQGVVDVGPDATDAVVVLAPPEPPVPGRGAIVLALTGDLPLTEVPLVIESAWHEYPGTSGRSQRGLTRTRTDDRGRALLTGLRPGVWSLTVSAPGVAPAFVQLFLTTDAVEEVTVPVVGVVTLEGRVIPPAGVDPTAVRLELSDDGRPFDRVPVAIDATGRWRADVQPGEVRLRAHAPGLVWRHEDVRAARTPAVQHTDPLTWGDDAGALRGRLVDAGGAPLADVELLVVSTKLALVSTGRGALDEQPLRATARTGPDGRFAARGLPPGACVVAACAAAAAERPGVLLGETPAAGEVARVEIPAGGEVDLGDVRAALGPGRLRGRLVGPDGRPVPGMTVRVTWRLRHVPLPPLEVAAVDGTFTVDRLPRGGVTLTIAEGQGWTVEQPVETTLEHDRVVDVAVPVVACARLHGRLLLPATLRGGPRVSLSNGRETRPVEVVDGVWSADGLAPGAWEVHVDRAIASLRVDLAAGETRALDVDLRGLSVVDLRVDGLPAAATSATVSLVEANAGPESRASASDSLRRGAATLLARPGRVRLAIDVVRCDLSDPHTSGPVAVERMDGWHLEREVTVAGERAPLVVTWPAPSAVVRGSTPAPGDFVRADDDAGLAVWVLATERFELALPPGRWRVRVVDDAEDPSRGSGPAVEVVVAPGAVIDLSAPLVGPE